MSAPKTFAGRRFGTAALLVLLVAGGEAASARRGGQNQVLVKPLVDISRVVGKPVDNWTAALGKPISSEKYEDRHWPEDRKGDWIESRTYQVRGLKWPTTSSFARAAKDRQVGDVYRFQVSFEGKGIKDWQSAVRAVGLWRSGLKAKPEERGAGGDTGGAIPCWYVSGWSKPVVGADFFPKKGDLGPTLQVYLVPSR